MAFDSHGHLNLVDVLDTGLEGRFALSFMFSPFEIRE